MKGSLFSSKPPSPLHSPHHHSYSVSPASTPPRGHHPLSETMMEENIDRAEPVIRKWDLDAGKLEKFSTLFVDDRKEAKRFLEAAICLQNAMHYYLKLSTSSEKLVIAQKLMRIAMKRLEEEFYMILSANRKNLYSESVSSRSSRTSTRSSVSEFYEGEVSEEEENTMMTPPRTPPSPGAKAERASDMAMADLKSIADCMIACGYGKECTLYYLGVERLNHAQMKKMEWTILEPKMKRWQHAVKVAVKTFFYGEKILCDIVFSSSEKIAESCFTEISGDAALNLFTFPENFGKCKKVLSPEKMFRALDIYEAISDLGPEIESIFSNKSLAAVRSQTVAALVKLGEAVRIMLGQFEAAIQEDSSKSPAGGGVHPLTRYQRSLRYCGGLAGERAAPPPEYHFSSPTSGCEAEPSAAAIRARLAWLILVLLCKLDGKAALYDHVALSYLFLANNLNYVVSKVRNSNLRLLMGSDWVWKHESKVKQYLANYERVGWKVIYSLPENPTAEIPPQEVRECFKNFYFTFQEAYKKQSSWVIPDPKLRDEVKISLAKKIVPGYRVFHQKHRGKYRREVGVESIVRYAPQDFYNYLSDLFFAASETSYTSSHRTYSTSYLSSRGR
ncbi:hypothetical protein Pfo_018169 [Paulownia fortunei]|nr:hypothetical protein Pfo_018169 [Paulownia fortunei]